MSPVLASDPPDSPFAADCEEERESEHEVPSDWELVVDLLNQSIQKLILSFV